MGRNADVSDETFLLSFQKTFVHACPIAGSVALRDHMQLIDVNIVGSQVLQRRLQILPEAFRCLCGGLGRDIYLVAHAVKGFADLHFTVRICSRGVKKPHAAFIRFPQELHSHFCRVALDGKTSECVLRHNDLSASQSDFFHVDPLLCMTGSG